MSLPLPSEEEWAAWKDSHVTKAFMEVLHRGREELKDDWAEGKFFGPDMMIENVRALARCETLLRVRDMSFEELIGALDDQEHVGLETPGPSGFATPG